MWQVSDHIEHDGKKYYEESYLIMANNAAKLRGTKLRKLEAEIKRLEDLIATWNTARTVSGVLDLAACANLHARFHSP